MSDQIASPEKGGLERALVLLQAGRPIAIPTETVYGLGADAANADAVARIYALKERPTFNPLIAHCASIDTAFEQGRATPGAELLASTFWPGPLTLVLDIHPSCTVCSLARSGLDTIAVRVPAHPITANLLKRFGRPIVAPSANPSGRISPTRPEHVAADFGDRIELILDGGPCEAGLESTIIDARGEVPVLLRQGPIPAAEIDAIWPGLKSDMTAPDAPRAPGQLLRHYAPKAALRLNATKAHPDEVLLGFGTVEGDVSLSQSGDLIEAAAKLFDQLRTLDEKTDRIAVAPIPNAGIGAAINDRLNRAAETK